MSMWYKRLNIRIHAKIFRTMTATIKGSGKLPTYPSPKPTLSLTSHLGQTVGLVEEGSWSVSQKHTVIQYTLAVIP